MSEPPNLMRYFILEETGTSWLLAMILDPHSEPAIRQAQSLVWGKFSAYLRDHGVEMRETYPAFVERGIYLDNREIDLLLGWDRWLVAIENKIQERAIVKGRLQEQYDRLRHHLVSNHWGSLGFGPQSNICLVFLVPGQGVGKNEYKELTVQHDQGDTKLYLTWKNLLGWLSETAWPQESALQVTFATMVAQGLQVARELLRRRKVQRSSSPPEYATFLAAVAERVDSAVEGMHPWQASSQQLRKTLYYSYLDKRVEYICVVSDTEVYLKLHLGTEKRNVQYRKEAKQALQKRFGTIQSRLGKVAKSWRSRFPRTVWETIPVPGGRAHLNDGRLIERVANRLIEYITIIHPIMQQINEEMGLVPERESGNK